MGSLSEGTTRLCHEINALRRGRETFMKDLARETRNRRVAVSEMRANFAFVRAAMARKAKAELSTFVSRLKCGAGERRQEMKADLAGARRAWMRPPLALEEEWPTAVLEKRTAQAPSKPEKKDKRKN